MSRRTTRRRARSESTKSLLLFVARIRELNNQMALDSFLLEILVDPEDKAPLWYFADDGVLYNPRLKRRYDVRDGIPVLLISEATAVDDGEAAQLTARAGEAVVTGSGPSDQSAPSDRSAE